MNDMPLQIYAIIYRPGPNWLEGRPVFEQPLLGHAQYTKKLFDAGILLLGGPFLDHTGGQSVIQVADLATAEAIVRDDPSVQDGIMVAELHRWHQVNWATFGQPASE